MAGRRQPKQNRLLAKLPTQVYEALSLQLELVPMPRDWDIYQPKRQQADQNIDFVYFPISSIVAIIKLLEDGASPEVAAIGNDGLVGVEVLMGKASATSRVVVQSAGFGYRTKAENIKRLFDADPEFRELVLRYIHVLFAQSSQIAACNRYHTVEQQVCRFLLTSLDRWNSNRISLTHQRVADLLGVRRAGVSEASAKLAQAGYIKYHRGCVTVLDRAGLESEVCECYKVISSEIDALLV